MASVTREQFVVSSEFEVVHIPTGAVFQGDLTDVLQSVKVNWGQGGSPTGDYAERIWRMGSQLLLVRAHQVARDRLASPKKTRKGLGLNDYRQQVEGRKDRRDYPRKQVVVIPSQFNTDEVFGTHIRKFHPAGFA